MQHRQTSEEEYAHWRMEAEAVADTYRAWLRAPRPVRWLAYATYLAALDREENAAEAYRRSVEQDVAASNEALP